MTITLPLQPEEEAKLYALADAKGLSADALVREALQGILAGASEIPDSALSERATGALLVAAMQASPNKEMDLEPFAKEAHFRARSKARSIVS